MNGPLVELRVKVMPESTSALDEAMRRAWQEAVAREVLRLDRRIMGDGPPLT